MANYAGYLPLGSVVMMKNGQKRVIIVGRGLSVKKDGAIYFFDYAGVLYPEGLTGANVCYFNNEWIDSVSFIGYNDEENRQAAAVIQNYVDSQPELKRYPQPEVPENK